MVLAAVGTNPVYNQGLSTAAAGSWGGMGRVDLVDWQLRDI